MSNNVVKMSRLPVPNDRPILDRFPMVLLSFMVGAIFWARPGQLAEVLVDVVDRPQVHLTMACLLAAHVGLTHLAFLRSRGHPLRWWDMANACLPLTLMSASMVREQSDAVPLALFSVTLTAGAICGFAPLVFRSLRPFERLVPSVLLIFVSATLLTLVFPVSFPRFVGSLGILLFGLGSITVAFAALIWAPRTGLAILFAIVLVEFFGEPETVVQTIPATNEAAGDHESVVRDWVTSRPDLDEYRRAKRPYPIILTSAEGGGIVAAVHAYSVLSGLAELCPSFTQHVFASVGVSGGSVGNGLFASRRLGQEAIPHVEPCKPTEMLAISSMGSLDYLAPVLATLFFVDMPNRLAAGLMFSTNRSITLTRAFETSGDEAAEQYLTRAIESSWKPSDLVPAQVYVTTHVATGSRLVLSPLYLWPVDWYLPSQERSISVSTAMTLSASFPWLTPTGRIHGDYGSVTLADGGYYENSGASTALEIAGFLRGLQFANIECGALPIDCGVLKFDNGCQLIVAGSFSEEVDWGCNYVVHITYLAISNSSAVFTYSDEEPPQSYWLDPIRTMLNMRIVRGREAVRDARGAFCSISNCIRGAALDAGFHTNVLPSESLGLPLGWSLSEGSVARILESSLSVEKCIRLQAKLQPARDDWPDFARFDPKDPATLQEENGCGLATIASLFDIIDKQSPTYYGIKGWPWLSSE